MELHPDEFLIPSFVTCSKREWTGSHYVVAVSEFPWVLNEGEREYSRMMSNFLRQAGTPAVGPGNAEDRQQGRHQNFPEGTRKSLRKAANTAEESSSATARRSDSAEGSHQRYATPEEPTPHPASDHGSHWTSSAQAAAAPRDTPWEDRRTGWRRRPSIRSTWSTPEHWASSRERQWDRDARTRSSGSNEPG